MKHFTNQTLAFYTPLYQRLAIIEGYEIRGLNVYVDFENRLLAHQLDYYDDDSRLCHIDSVQENKAFEIFSIAYLSIQEKMHAQELRADYEDVIEHMQLAFLDSEVGKDIGEGVEFTIMFIPLEGNPLEIPQELLLHAAEKILRN